MSVSGGLRLSVRLPWCGFMIALWLGPFLPGAILEVSVAGVAVPRCGVVLEMDARASCARWGISFGLWGLGVRRGPCS